MKYNLGRIHVPDERDVKFPLSAASIKEAPGVKYKYWWAQGWWGNQGNTSQCVAYSWLAFLEDGPVTHFYKNRDFDPAYLNENRHEKHQPLFNPENIYKAAQEVDQWPGTDYKGTSVRAGAKILKRLGVISEYRWAYSIKDIENTLLNLGPLVVGTWWYSDMFYPDKNGFIVPTGEKAGGHAYLLNGINLKKGFIRIKNSWGRNWGKDGYAYIRIEDFEKLLLDYGEACMAFEKKLKE